MKSLKDVIEFVKPHALFGLSGGGPAFDEPIIRAMCASTPRPLIFPLSNPTSKAEVSAENAYNWSDGQRIFAGIGFGAWAVGATECADLFFIEAAKELADC